MKHIESSVSSTINAKTLQHINKSRTASLSKIINQTNDMFPPFNFRIRHDCRNNGLSKPITK